MGDIVYKFETLKKKAKEEASKAIDQCDVRNVRKLIERFPGIVSKECLNREIACEIDDAENWLVIFKARQGSHHERGRYRNHDVTAT